MPRNQHVIDFAGTKESRAGSLQSLCRVAAASVLRVLETFLASSSAPSRRLVKLQGWRAANRRRLQ